MFTSPLTTVGLNVSSIQLQTTSNNVVNLQLIPKKRAESDHGNDDYVPNIAYLLMRYGVSMEFYHELSMVVDDLPRSHKVASYLFKEIVACN